MPHSDLETTGLAAAAYYACGNGVVGSFVYQDRHAEGVVFLVGRGGDQLSGFEADTADIVEFKCTGGFGIAENVHIPNVGDRVDSGRGSLGGVLR